MVDPSLPSLTSADCSTMLTKSATPMAPTNGENKRKHLEFVQGVINRMANTSFLLKGWSITVVAGLFALGASERKLSILLLALVLNLVFWFLDAFFLWQERMYRALYDAVRAKHEDQIDFSMDATPFANRASWCRATFSSTLVPFYCGVLLVLIIFLIIV